VVSGTVIASLLVFSGLTKADRFGRLYHNRPRA